MAIKYKKLKNDLENKPLTPEELSKVKEVEDYIDSEILDQFDGGSVDIELGIARFEHDHKHPYGSLGFKSDRAAKMSDELDGRYIRFGWKIEIEFDDGLDGPNRSGPDYWVLSGKDE